jgi:hypothetical protein
LKNLAKDPIHYTKDGQFGVKDLGYVTEHPGLGTPKEATGKYKSSGYGNLNEVKELNVGDKVKYKGITVTVEKKDEVGNLVLKSESGKTIRANKSQFKEYGSLEEEKLRKAIREIIDAELGEATQMTTIIRPQVSDKEREERDPQDMYVYLKGATEELLKKNQHLRILRDPKTPEQITGIAIRSRLLSPQNLKKLPYDINPMFVGFLNTANNIGGKITLPTREGGTDDYTLLNNVNVGREGRLSFFIPNPKKEVKEDTLESLRESVEKDLAAINKEAEHEVLQSKLDKIQDLIDKRQSQLGKLDEDEDMKALTDKKKVKELEKDIKKLEQAKSKVEKILSKTKGKKKEVIDETEDDMVDENMPIDDNMMGEEMSYDENC